MSDASRFRLPAFADKPDIHEFLTIWDRWRGSAMMPVRSDVALSDIRHFVENMMLFDMVGPDNIHIRYIGSAFHDIYGQDFTGLNYLDTTEPKYRETRSKRLTSVVERPCAAVWGTLQSQDYEKVPTALGVSVPIRPDEADKPMQLMQVAVMWEDFERSAFASRQALPTVPFSVMFEFLDIGAGCPEIPWPEMEEMPRLAGLN